MSAHYFIGIKSPINFDNLIDTYKAKYQLTERYKVIPHPDDLHMTLHFIGAMSEQSLPALTINLQMIAEKTPAFTMDVDGLSYFGSSSGPRVVYLSIKESDKLSTLEKQINETIATQFNKPISDRFTPHITIAKKRKTTEKLFIQKEKWKPIEVLVSSFALFKIHPEKSPKYETIETFKLT